MGRGRRREREDRALGGRGRRGSQGCSQSILLSTLQTNEYQSHFREEHSVPPLILNCTMYVMHGVVTVDLCTQLMNTVYLLPLC